MKTDIALLWNALGGLTWLDIGNGWRNLFLLSCLVQALALGTLFALKRLFSRRSRVAAFLAGAAATPLVQYLWTLLLALLWPKAPRWFYIGVLPALACLLLAGALVRHRKGLRQALRRGWAFALRLCRLDKPTLVALCFALALALLVLPPCIRLCGSMNAAHSGDSGEYMALAQRYCQDRDFEQLLSKEDETGHFRGNNHFPSLELYMAYGLMHTGETYGYPYDKPMLFGVGMLSLYMLVAYGALLVELCRQRKAWVLLGALLINLVPGLYESVNGAPRDIWRILALLLAMLYFAGLSPGGGWRRYLPKALATLLVCFAVTSTHVVCFVVLPFVVVAWVLARWYEGGLAGKGRAAPALGRSLGLALLGAAGTLAGFGVNLWCYARWGNVSPFRVMSTYTSAPWYGQYMATEYKLEETTTSLNFWASWQDIVMAYATPIGLWGLRLALAGLACALGYFVWSRWTQGRVATVEGSLPVHSTEEGRFTAGMLLYAALLTLCTLAPMTGLLDSPLYSFSGSFLALQRYTLQWFVLAGAMICATLAALQDAWPTLCAWAHRRLKRPYSWLLKKAWWRPLRQGLLRLPPVLCAVLCLLAFRQGVDQTGYSNSFYRYSRTVMEDESTLLDNGFLQRYSLLMVAARHVPSQQKMLLTRMGYQYPIGAKGYILTANPIVPLLNLSLEQVPQALADKNVALLATEPDFWDERYFAASTLSQYLNALPQEQILTDGHMRLYVLSPALADAIWTEWEAAGK